MGLSWNAIDSIMQRAVKRGMSRREELSPTRIGVDETAFKKQHDYVTIVSDQKAGTVIYVGSDRKKATLKAWYESLSDKQREAIESVSMDMWPAFINSTLESIPGAEEKITFDKFHVAKYLCEADVVIFKPKINGDWRRRNNVATLLNMLVVIEVKASERANGRLQPSEIMFDIQKLAAHRQEAKARKANMLPVMLIIDSAPLAKERMTDQALAQSENLAKELGVGFLYISPNHEIYRI